MTWVPRGAVVSDRPRATQGPQERPRGAQDSPKRPQEASRGSQTGLGAISKRLSNDFVGPGTSKNLKKCCTVNEFRGSRDFAREPSTEAQEAPKEAPREAQMSPRRAPGGPRSGPSPDGSKSLPERAKRRPRPPRSAPGEQAAQKPILASSWGPRGLIFEPSRCPFRASRAVR